jgi:hypothetical protein
MPIVLDGRSKKQRFRCKATDEVKLLESVKEDYRQKGHDLHDFVLDFFGIGSSNSSAYFCSVRNGEQSISTDAWNKIIDYASKQSGK